MRQYQCTSNIVVTKYKRDICLCHVALTGSYCEYLLVATGYNILVPQKEIHIGINGTSAMEIGKMVKIKVETT